MLRLCAALAKYGFPDSMPTKQAHSPAKLYTAVLETHSPADGTQPGNILNCNLKKLHSFWNAWTTLTPMHPNKNYYGKSGHSVPIENCICEKPTTSEAWPSRRFLNTAWQISTAVRIYIAELCAKLPGCVKGHSWYWDTTAVVGADSAVAGANGASVTASVGTVTALGLHSMWLVVPSTIHICLYMWVPFFRVPPPKIRVF